MSSRQYLQVVLVLAVTFNACGGADEVTDNAAPAMTQVSDSAQAEQVELKREIFRYRGSGRDPFQSLVADGVSLRPFIQDLRVSSILFDARYPSRSVAVLVDESDNSIYEVRTGTGIGRLRIGRITENSVVITIVELGVPRQVELEIPTPGSNQ